MKKSRPTQAAAAIAILLAASFVTLPPAGAAGESLQDLAWLTGTWLQERDDGATIEVIWGAPRGDAMVGTWRTIKDGELKAYEILTMRQTDEGITYRFDLYRKAARFVAPGSTSFKLVELDGKRALFDLEDGPGRITIEITGEGRLRGAWSDPEKPDLPPTIGYDAAPVE